MRRNQKWLGNGLGVPSALVGKKHRSATDYDFDKRKQKLAHLVPPLTKRELMRTEQSHHIILFEDLMEEGREDVVEELKSIFRKEDRERKKEKSVHKNKPLLAQEFDKLDMVANVLRLCHDFVKNSNFDLATFERKQLAEKLATQGDTWLSKHFFLSVLPLTKHLHSPDKERIQAEVHCQLAFLTRSNNETLESALASAVDHLAICRKLAKNQNWQFKPRVLTIKIQKPIALHGYRVQDPRSYEAIDGCSLPMYMIATLLEHDMLMGLANQIMHSHSAPLEEEVKEAHQYADLALQLALEVRHPAALSAALVKFGLVLRHSGLCREAFKYFEELQHHASVVGDYMSEAIAFHNLGMCMIGEHNTVGGLEYFVKQKELASEDELKDLEGDAFSEIGYVLLEEGHLWEAEECHAIAYSHFNKVKDISENHVDAEWILSAITAGHKLYPRMAGLCRTDTVEHLHGIINWKSYREKLPSVKRPDRRIQPISSMNDKINVLHGAAEEVAPISFREQSPPSVSISVMSSGRMSEMESQQILGYFDDHGEFVEVRHTIVDSTRRSTVPDRRKTGTQPSSGSEESFRFSTDDFSSDHNNHHRYPSFKYTKNPKSR